MEIKRILNPRDIEEYKIWLKQELHIEVTNRTKNYYETNIEKVKKSFENSTFWVKFQENMREFEAQYKINTSFQLLSKAIPASIKRKSFESFLLKTFRKNVLDNKDFPKPPSNGWFLPSQLNRINDVARTLIVVKYLDGVDFLIKNMEVMCKEFSLEMKADYEAKEEGYYAVHLYISDTFSIQDEDWNTKKEIFPIEIQISTQVQDLIRSLLHKYYVENRKSLAKENTKKWQWNYQHEEFASNYLGHILHYVEGMIMEVRNKQNLGRGK